MGLLGDMFKGTRMKDPVRGEAQVVSSTAHRGDGVWQNCRMQLVVQAEGVAATSVEHNELVHTRKWPSPGMTLPVTVDRSNPQKFKVEWDEVPDSRERAAVNADALAAMMRGETPPGAGIDIDQLAARQGYGPAPPQEAVADSNDDVDDQLARLAKLGQLRDSGVLTPEEFEQQKRRILDG